MKILGIYRETQNSPNRVDDDALILRAVMDQMSILKTETVLATPEQFDAMDPVGFDMLVPMCETYPRLMRLKNIAARTGLMIVNPADAVLGCYRTRMLEAFAMNPAIRVPPTEVRRTTAEANVHPPAFPAPHGWWLKRGDVHNTCAHDVVHADSWEAAEAIRRDFENREITNMAVQSHVDGDLIKFYGVGPGQWFTWFYHDPATSRRLPFELEDLAEQAEMAAKAVDLEIYGGDAIVAPGGEVCVIDINSWPSFSRVRTEAAVQIARRLRMRLRELSRRAA